MAINYIATTQVNCRIKTTDGDDEGEEVVMLAFGWADAQPEKCTGIWVLRGDHRGVAFIPHRTIHHLEPRHPQEEEVSKRAYEMALTALDAVSNVNVKVRGLMGEVQLAEDVAVGVAIAHAEERREAEAAAAEREEVAGQSPSRPARSTARKSSSAKTAGRPASGRGNGQKRGR